MFKCHPGLDQHNRVEGLSFSFIYVCVQFIYIDCASCCVSVWWAGQQREEFSWFTLRCPTRLHLRQGGVPHGRPSRLLCCGRPRVHLPCSPQLPLRRLQDWQWRVCTQGQHGPDRLYQTSPRPLPVLWLARLHDPLLILCVDLSILTKQCTVFESKNIWMKITESSNKHYTIIQLVTVCCLYFIVPACFVMPSLFLDAGSAILGCLFLSSIIYPPPYLSVRLPEWCVTCKGYKPIKAELSK